MYIRWISSENVVHTYTHRIPYYLPIKKNEITKFSDMWMELEKFCLDWLKRWKQKSLLLFLLATPGFHILFYVFVCGKIMKREMGHWHRDAFGKENSRMLVKWNGKRKTGTRWIPVGSRIINKGRGCLKAQTKGSVHS